MGKPDVSPTRDCWICYNNENNVLTTVKSQKILKKFNAYLETPFFKKPTEVTPVDTCCIYCYESVLQLTLLEEQIEKLQKDISDLSSFFSANIMDRRNRFANGKSEDSNKSTDSTPTTEKYFAVKNNSDLLSNFLIENGIVMKEDVGNISKELASDIQPEMEIEKIFTNMFPELDEQAIFATDKSRNDINCKYDVDVKYSYDQTVSEEDCNVSKSIVPMQSVLQTDSHDELQANATSPDLLKLLSMPIVKIKRLQQCGSSDSQKTVDVAFGETIKYGKDILYHSAKQINNLEIKSQGSNERQKTFNKLIKTINNRKELIYLEENPHTCSVCNEAFESLGLLKRHVKCHSRKKSYKCSFCSKSFCELSHLKNHERIHTGERRFKCSYCPKTFCQSSEKIQTGERPYKCYFCSKSFSMPNTLKRHKIIHTRDKQYKCQI